MKKLKTILILLLINSSLSAQKSKEIKFKKLTLDTTYVSEGACTGDIDKDGLVDVIAGDVWYKAPKWTRHQIRPLGIYYGMMPEPTRPRGSGGSYYARSIANFVKDIDGDGWLDVITMNSQGSPAYWYRNPAGKKQQYWQEYLAVELFHNESPQMVDLFGDGNKVILAGNHIGGNKYTLSWFEIPADPTKLWIPHIIGHPDDFKYVSRFGPPTYYAPGGMGHGLGLADMNKDGRQDILTAKGWYDGNSKTAERWNFNAFPLDSLADEKGAGLTFSHMHAADFDGDGDMDILGSSAHRYGLWWFEQQKAGPETTFAKHEISMKYSQLHSMAAFDFDKDGTLEYVAAKRYLAHLGKDPGEIENDAAVVIYTHQEKNGEFTTHIIDDNSAAGTQIWFDDMNKDGRMDIVTSNKKGTRIFYQQK
jgi:hypothetical protein